MTHIVLDNDNCEEIFPILPISHRFGKSAKFWFDCGLRKMGIDVLFELLDLNNDGHVSRAELHIAAERMGWHWQEAPIFALLDLLTIPAPITRKQFAGYLQQITDDSMGPYGNVLLNSPCFSSALPPGPDQHLLDEFTNGDAISNRHRRKFQDADLERDLVTALEKSLGTDISNGYHSLLNTFDT